MEYLTTISAHCQLFNLDLQNYKVFTYKQNFLLIS
jgi:hypothetical protein